MCVCVCEREARRGRARARARERGGRKREGGKEEARDLEGVKELEAESMSVL
jgi:hypothetical protein